MVFIESSIFTSLVAEFLPDESYAALQAHLSRHPQAGDVVQGLGGLRKVRWGQPGRGKSGGVRVIYFHVSSESQIRMVLIYPKSAKVDLSARDRKIIIKMMEQW